MKAVFLDRDGTINIERPRYLLDVENLEIIEQAAPAIRLLNKHKYKSIVITNQSCVGRGILQENILQDINKTMKERLAQNNAFIDSVYYCPHHPDKGCRCRKPKIGMLQQAVREHDVDLKNSYVIGDREFDIAAGKSAGCKTILVMTGGGKETLKRFKEKEYEPDYIASHILEAVQWIIATDQ